MIKFSKNLKGKLTDEEKSCLDFFYHCLKSNIQYPGDMDELIRIFFKVYHFIYKGDYSDLVISDIANIIKSNTLLSRDLNLTECIREHMELYLSEPATSQLVAL